MKIKHPMNNTNTNKEHLQYSDREQNMKILFLTHAKFSTHAKILWNHTTHATHTIFWPTQLTPKLYEPTLLIFKYFESGVFQGFFKSMVQICLQRHYQM